MRPGKPSLLFLFGALLAACKPSVGQPPYLVTDYTLLAVQGTPPEAKPGADVSYSFLLASPTGPVSDAEAWWDICQTPKPPSESNSVSSECASAPDAGAGAIGQTFAAAIPLKACQLFGPIAPPPVSGKPAVRPRDPDSTGGYYLPVQVWLPNLATGPLSGFAFERISCGLANAPSAVISDYNSKYQVNGNPGIDQTDLVLDDGARLSLDAGPQAVPVGSTVTLEATFAAGSAETFPYYDPTAETLVDQTESLHMSWFVTGGTFEHNRTGVGAGEAAVSTSNIWTAPAQPGTTVYLWLVLRDSRGGMDAKAYSILVTS
jgi:hypothetical protein